MYANSGKISGLYVNSGKFRLIQVNSGRFRYIQVNLAAKVYFERTLFCSLKNALPYSLAKGSPKKYSS